MRDGYGGEYYRASSQWERSKVVAQAIQCAERTGSAQLIHEHPKPESCVGQVHLRVVAGQEPELIEVADVAC